MRWQVIEGTILAWISLFHPLTTKLIRSKRRNDLHLLMLLHFRGTSEANEQLAELPPRGWNSYDSFSWIVDENTYMQNAEILAEKLLPHGYEVIIQIANFSVFGSKINMKKINLIIVLTILFSYWWVVCSHWLPLVSKVCWWGIYRFIWIW